MELRAADKAKVVILCSGKPVKDKKGRTTNSSRQAAGRPRPPREKHPTHSEDGVDLTLIRWMLRLTPAERLQVLQRNIRSIIKLREKIGT
jgi:hypothetical protein